MRESLAGSRDRPLYLGHARQHIKRIELALPGVKARAKAQEREDPEEGGKTGCIERLMQYHRILDQYAAEFKLYREITGNEVDADELMLAHLMEEMKSANEEEVDDGGR